jgi:hypothetical protein
MLLPTHFSLGLVLKEVIIHVREHVRNFALSALSLICHRTARSAHFKGTTHRVHIKARVQRGVCFSSRGCGVGWSVVQRKVDDVVCFKFTL